MKIRSIPRKVEVLIWETNPKVKEERSPNKREEMIFDCIDSVFNNPNRKQLTKVANEDHYFILVYTDKAITGDLIKEMERLTGYHVEIRSTLYGLSISFIEDPTLNPSKR